MNKIKYDLTLITHFDCGYNFSISNGNDDHDEQNIKSYLALLNQKISKYPFKQRKPDIYRCLTIYQLNDHIEVYMMNNGSFLITIHYENQTTEMNDDFSKNVYINRFNLSFNMMKKEAIINDQTRMDVYDINLFKSSVYETTNEFIKTVKYKSSRLRPKTYGDQYSRFNQHSGLSYMHAFYAFDHQDNKNMDLSKHIPILINQIEANKLSIESLDKINFDLENSNQKFSDCAFTQIAFANASNYDNESLRKSILYYLSYWYYGYNLMYNIEKYDYDDIALTEHENTITYNIEKLNNINAEIFSDIKMNISIQLVSALRVIPYLKKVLLLIQNKRRVIDVKRQQKMYINSVMVKTSMLIFTALSMFKTVFDVIHEQFDKIDWLVLAMILVLLILSSFYDTLFLENKS
ncbi:MAG: hypothetical protein WCR19_05550 [Acholeplasmataceae bacterium]